MSKRILAAIWVAVLMGLFSCKPQPTALDGQVFIVTRGGESIKLGLVSVQLMDPGAVQIALTKSLSEVHGELVGATAKLDAARREESEALNALNRATSRSLAASDRVNNGDISATAISAWTAATKRIQPSTDAYTAATFKTAAASTSLNALVGEQRIFEALPAPFAQAQTDADGHFHMLLERIQPVVIAARAQRYLGDTTETYYWLLNFTPSSSSKVTIINLSNDKLLGAAPNEAVIDLEKWKAGEISSIQLPASTN